MALPFLFGCLLPLLALVWLLVAVAIAVISLDHVVAVAFVAVAVVLFAFLFFGRFVILLFRPGFVDEPRPSSTVRAHTITSRQRTPLYVDSIGPKEQFSLIFCHGWGVTGDVWYYLKKSRRLERLGRLTTWDLRGTGRSGQPPEGAYTLESLARDLRDVVESEGARRIVLAGHGLGGLVVLEYCRLFADQLGRRVAGLILISTPLQPVGAAPAMLQLSATLSPIVALLNRLVYLSGLGHLGAALAAFGGRESRGQLDFFTRAATTTKPAVAAKEAQAMAGFDPAPVLSTLPVPVLLITGVHDKTATRSQIETSAARYQNFTAVVLPHSGALSFLERSGEFEQRLRDWLEVLPGGPGGRHVQRRREREAAEE